MAQRAVKWVVAGALTVAVATACSDPLSVKNNNSPDVGRVFATAAGIEQYIATSFKTYNQAEHSTNDNINDQLLVMSLESYATVANFGMGARSAIPRLLIQNTRANVTYLGTNNDFTNLSTHSRQIANAVNALDDLTSKGGTLGSAAQNARARAFGFFTLGLTHGDLAMVYDSAAVTTLASARTLDVPPLRYYPVVMQAALADLDSAIAIASNPAVASGISYASAPTDWIRGNTLTAADFVRVCRSYKARYRAGVARNPAERAAVDWSAVIADAQNGITSDLNISLSATAGWTHAEFPQLYTYQGWHLMSPFYIGMADTTGAYNTWLSQSLTTRVPFLIRTPDKRFPAGDTRVAQQTSSGSTTATVKPPTAVPGTSSAAAATQGLPYFRNRPTGQDTPGDPWGVSNYDHYRFLGFVLANADRAGLWPTMTKVEIDMLAAEGFIRKGDYPSAAALIDKSRTAIGGLPAITGSGALSASTVVTGGNACVPRVPAPPAFTSTTCGSIYEAMKWEKRMETAFTGYGQWFFDSRGWGDLVEGTAQQFPVPYQEMDARFEPFYNMGGPGDINSAKKGTYGF